jgi:hypothetical protein
MGEMKYTAKQRAKIYRKAAKFIHDWESDTGRYPYGICFAIRFISKVTPDYMYKEFPEVFLFNNDDKFYWWGIGETNERILALLLSAEIAESKIKTA